MGFDQGRVVFDKEDLNFKPGDEVHGTVVFDQEKDKTFRGMYVKLKGFCDVRWTTRHTRKVNGKTQHYTKEHTSHESYIEQKIYLMGGESGEVHLKPGHYEMPFKFSIPAHVPSSFEGSNGHIRYVVKVVIDRAFKFDQEKKTEIIVFSPIDLNNDPYCQNVMEFEFEHTFCSWCMTRGSMEFHAKLPQSGYSPGQTMNIDLSCANNSNIKINFILFELIERRQYIATHNASTLKEKNVLAKLRKGPVPANTIRNWILEMDIPEIDLYNLNTCKYININHEIKVTVSSSGCHSNPDSSRRIVLGHIPLREFEGPPNDSQQNDIASYIDADQKAFLLERTNTIGRVDANSSYIKATAPHPELYSAANPPYLMGNSPYPMVNSPYPMVNSPNPMANPTYPMANPTYPMANPPNPMANPTYPMANSPHPMGKFPYPNSNPSYPGVAPSNT